MSADGEILASGSEDKTIKLWQLSTGMQIGTLTLGNWFSRDSGCVYAIAMSPQEEILASLDNSGAVKLWNLKTGQEIRRLKGDTSWINAIAISPTGKTLVAASGDSIKLWNLRTGGQFPILRGHNSWVRAVTFSPDGQTLASGSDDATIKLWNLRTGGQFPILRGHNSWVRAVTFSPDGQTLASGSDDATIKLWNLKTGRELCTLRGHLGAIYSIAFSPIYEPFPSRLASDNRSQSTVEGMTFSASGNQASTAPFTQAFSKAQELGVRQILASSSDDRTIKLWDTSTGQELCTLTGHTRWVHRVVFSPSGQTLVSGGGDPMIYIWQCVSLNSRTSVQ
jgi:WD40 repeat protein